MTDADGPGEALQAALNGSSGLLGSQGHEQASPMPGPAA